MKLFVKIKNILKLLSKIEFEDNKIIFADDIFVISKKNINVASNFENIDPNTNLPYRINLNCRREIDGNDLY